MAAVQGVRTTMADWWTLPAFKAAPWVKRERALDRALGLVQCAWLVQPQLHHCLAPPWLHGCPVTVSASMGCTSSSTFKARKNFKDVATCLPCTYFHCPADEGKSAAEWLRMLSEQQELINTRDVFRDHSNRKR
jgi:hypothetical protein